VFRSQAAHVPWPVSASPSQQRHRSHTRRRHIATSNCYAPHRYGAHRYAGALRVDTRPCLLMLGQIGANTASSAFEAQGKLLGRLFVHLRTNIASPSSVQASFGFDFGGLGARPAKQSSLPPQRSGRRTPVRTTPRGANGSAKRHRSASLQPGSSSKRGNTPKAQTVTPHLGKRKRGSNIGVLNEDDGEEDELSPDREEIVRSIEKSRRVVGAVSPIREEIDDAPDELSVLEDGGTARKTTAYASPVANGTPLSVLAQKSAFAGKTLARTPPLADRLGSMRLNSPQSTARKSKSTEPGSTTPILLPNGQSTLSVASPANQPISTPGVAPVDDESEDELSPAQDISATPRVVMVEQRSETVPEEVDHTEIDELSSPIQATPVQATPVQATPAAQRAARAKGPKAAQKNNQPAAAEQPTKRGRPRRVVLDDEDEAPSAPVPAKPTKRGRPAKTVETKTVATPAAQNQKRKKGIAEDEVEEEELDELSPDKDRTAETSRQPTKRSKEIIHVSDGEESEYEEAEPEDEPTPLSRPVAQRPSPKRKQNVEPSSEKPPRKRHRFLGPKHAISVMRIKGSTVRGITVADTTRTILEETIDHSLGRMAEKLQTSQDSTRRKELRSMLNMSLSFKESLNEKLLDLQDANDVLSTNFKKMKLFKRDNAELRKDILRLQNNRQEIALEQDDVIADHDAEKARADARNKLSEDMFSIEAAIQNGRKKARAEGRENEGPQLPLSMMLGMVGQDVGSSGGGLLSNVKIFSGALERAAGWLEGRA
jgi:hypothetical protein